MKSQANINRKPKPLRTLAVTLVVGGVAAVALALAYWNLAHAVYESTAKVRVERRGMNLTDKPSAAGGAAPSEADFRDAEYRFVQSDEFLRPVVENLGLAKTWGDRFTPGQPLKTPEALALLRTKARIQWVPRTTMLEARVMDADAELTARIANEIVRRYHDHCQARRASAGAEAVASAKQQLDAQTQKVREARYRLGDVVMEIEKARFASTSVDPESLEAMRSNHVWFETEYNRLQNQLTGLKALSPDRLRVVLPTIATNAVLDGMLQRLASAQSDLHNLKSTAGPDSPELKHAAILVQELDRSVDRTIQGILSRYETEQAAVKSMLDKLDATLSTAATNTAGLSTNNPAYLQALGEVEAQEHLCDELKQKLENSLIVAASPYALSAQIVETATPPTTPVSPDRKLAVKLIATGGGALLLGVLLFLLAPLTGKPRTIRRS